VILIRNVKVVDGTGQPAYPADVLISGDRISAIGSFPHRKADSIIDGLGAYLCPGFIDVHSQADHYLKIFTDPGQSQYLEQGITTIIGGQDGASLAPLLYGSLKSIQKYTDTNQINVNWHSFAEFTQTLKKLSLAVNFGSLIGHSTIRRDLTHDAFTDLTDPELAVFKKMIGQALAEGGLGLSVGLNTVHARRVPQQEIKELLTEVAAGNGLYAARLRDEKRGLVNAVNETIFVYKATGVRTIIGRFQPLLGSERQFDLALKILEEAGDGIFFDISPQASRLLPAYVLLPEWAQVGGLKEMLAFIADTNNRQRILEWLPKNQGNLVIKETTPAHRYLIGKNLKDFAANRKLSLQRGLLELLLLTEMKLILEVPDVNEEKLKEVILHDRALITSPVAKFLEVAEAQRWPLERAVAKLTSLPARVLGLTARGLIKENYFADLVLIKDKKVQQVLVNGSNGGQLITS